MTPILATLATVVLPFAPPHPSVAPPEPSVAPPQPSAVWPLDPRPQVVHGFELPPKAWMPGHRGVDLSGSPGQAVRAATAGTITYAGTLAGRGVITVSTGSRRTTYEPVVASVSLGATVTAGTVIGHLSAAASHCAPATCLHWGLLEDNQYRNPLTLLANRPVRLLPLQAAIAPSPQAAAAPSPTQSAFAASPARSAAALYPAQLASALSPAPPTSAASPTRAASAASSAQPASALYPAQLAPAPSLAQAASALSLAEPASALYPAQAASAPSPAHMGPAHPTPRAGVPSTQPRADDRTGSIVVGATAALTLFTGLMIKRH